MVGEFLNEIQIPQGRDSQENEMLPNIPHGNITISQNNFFLEQHNHIQRQPWATKQCFKAIALGNTIISHNNCHKTHLPQGKAISYDNKTIPKE